MESEQKNRLLRQALLAPQHFQISNFTNSKDLHVRKILREDQRERYNARRRVAALSEQQREKKRASQRVISLTEDQIEKRNARRRVTALSREQLEKKRNRHKFTVLTEEQREQRNLRRREYTKKKRVSRTLEAGLDQSESNRTFMEAHEVVQVQLNECESELLQNVGTIDTRESVASDFFVNIDDRTQTLTVSVKSESSSHVERNFMVGQDERENVVKNEPVKCESLLRDSKGVVTSNEKLYSSIKCENVNSAEIETEDIYSDSKMTNCYDECDSWKHWVLNAPSEE